jgi:hypothetical protein
MKKVHGICAKRNGHFKWFRFISEYHIEILYETNNVWKDDYEVKKKMFQRNMFPIDCKLSDDDFKDSVARRDKITRKELPSVRRELADARKKRMISNQNYGQVIECKDKSKQGRIKWVQAKEAKHAAIQAEFALFEKERELLKERNDLNGRIYMSNKASEKYSDVEVPVRKIKPTLESLLATSNSKDVGSSQKATLKRPTFHADARDVDLRSLESENKFSLLFVGEDPGHVYASSCSSLPQNDEPRAKFRITAAHMGTLDRTSRLASMRKHALRQQSNQKAKQALDAVTKINMDDAYTTEDIEKYQEERLELSKTIREFEQKKAFKKLKAEVERFRKKQMYQKIAAQQRKLAFEHTEKDMDVLRIPVVCHGSGYRPFNSPFGGRPRRNGFKLAKLNGQNTIAVQTPENYSSQLCDECRTPLCKAMRRCIQNDKIVTKPVNGALECRNLNCRAYKEGRSVKNRDTRVSAFNIAYIGREMMLSDDGLPPAEFRTTQEKYLAMRYEQQDKQKLSTRVHDTENLNSNQEHPGILDPDSIRV